LEAVNPLQSGVSVALSSLPSLTNQAYALLGLSLLDTAIPAQLKARTLADFEHSFSPASRLFAEGAGSPAGDHLELTSLVLGLAYTWPEAAPGLLTTERIPLLRRALTQATDSVADRTTAADALVLLDALTAGPQASTSGVCERLSRDAHAQTASVALLGAAVRAGCRASAPGTPADPWPDTDAVLTKPSWPDFDHLLLAASAGRPCPVCQHATATVNTTVQRTGEYAAPLVPIAETGSLYRAVLLARATAATPPPWVGQALVRQLAWQGRINPDVHSDPLLVAWALRTMQAGSDAVPAGVLDRLRPAVGHQGDADGPYGLVIRAIASGATGGQVARLVSASSSSSPASGVRGLARLAAGVVYSASCPPAIAATLREGARSSGLALPPQASADPLSRYYAALVWRALGICQTAGADLKPSAVPYAGVVRAAMAKASSTPADWQVWPALWLDAEAECTVTGQTSLDRTRVRAAFNSATQGDLHDRYDVAAAYALARVAQMARFGCGGAWWQPS